MSLGGRSSTRSKYNLPPLADLADTYGDDKRKRRNRAQDGPTSERKVEQHHHHRHPESTKMPTLPKHDPIDSIVDIKKKKNTGHSFKQHATEEGKSTTTDAGPKPSMRRHGAATPSSASHGKWVVEKNPLDDSENQPLEPKWYSLYNVSALLSLLWASILWFGLIVNIDFEGYGLYSEYFTNWNWTLNLIFYTIDVFAAIEPSGLIRYYWLLFAWWPMIGNTAQVFFLVMQVFYVNPSIITDAGDEYGYGLTLNVDRTKHVFPYAFGILWFGLRAFEYTIYLSLLVTDSAKRKKTMNIWIYYVITFITVHLVLVLYVSIFDFRKIYGIEDINVFLWLVIAELIYWCTTFIPVLLLSPMFKAQRDAFLKQPLLIPPTILGRHEPFAATVQV